MSEKELKIKLDTHSNFISDFRAIFWAVFIVVGKRHSFSYIFLVASFNYMVVMPLYSNSFQFFSSLQFLYVYVCIPPSLSMWCKWNDWIWNFEGSKLLIESMLFPFTFFDVFFFFYFLLLLQYPISGHKI